MKNKVHLFASLLGTTLLLTGCNIDTASLPASSLEALAKEAPVQEVAAGNTNTLKTVSNQTQASANSSVSDNTAVASQKNYIQVFIDPNTGELVTINPDTGEAVPYTAPAATAASLLKPPFPRVLLRPEPPALKIPLRLELLPPVHRTTRPIQPVARLLLHPRLRRLHQ